MNENHDFTIANLGKQTINSPIFLTKSDDDYIANYVSDDDCIHYFIEAKRSEKNTVIPETNLMELAGPRAKIYFDPTKVHAALVTCGGLCPGLNDVIRSIVMCLWYRYGVRRITGIRYGYRGFLPDFGYPTLELTPDVVADIHRDGGTILGSSRGYGDKTIEVVDCMERMNINMLFVIGGDGTQKGALSICNEIKSRNLKIALVGIPKTIDNDLSFVQKSFGFETAVSSAVTAVSSAHVEASDAVNGIGIVKVMGRESGFIAAHTTLAHNDVNYVLIPEVPFDLHGENGLLYHVEHRLKDRNHALILVAEGAGQDLLESRTECDASGNKKFNDIGIFLRDEMINYFKQRKIEINLKYIDPSYIIRSLPANSNDKLYCTRLGNNAVHAAMAGKTCLLISLYHDYIVHVPIQLAVSKKNLIDPESSLWRDVIDATGQPFLMKSKVLQK